MLDGILFDMESWSAHLAFGLSDEIFGSEAGCDLFTRSVEIFDLVARRTDSIL